MTTATQEKAKVSADALDDTQFAFNPQDLNNQQQNQKPEDQSTKKKRKRNNKKNKTPAQSTAEPSPLKTDENSIINPSNDENPPSKKKKKNNKSNPSNDPAIEKQKSIASAARLKRSKEKKKAKAKEKLQKCRAAANQMKEQYSSTPEESVNESSSIGLQPPDLQLNYLKDRQKRALSDLSDLELESFPLEKSWLQDVSDKPLRAHLGPWLKTGAVPGFLEALEQTADLPGTPTAIVVTSAALRAADLYRQMKRLVEKPEKSGQVTKLFAKHFKLQDHIKHVKTTKISIAVGTPHRISTLLSRQPESEDGSKTTEDEAALKLTRLKFIIFDLTWLDHKGFNLTELPDSLVKDSLWKSLLGFPELVKKFQSGQTKLVLF